MTSTVAAQLFEADFPQVDGVTAEVYEVPTDRPEADGTLAWSKTTLVLVRVTGGGTTGLGYTYATGACKPLIEGELAAAIAGVSTLDTGTAWQAMVRAVRNLGRPGLVSCAISAVDAACGTSRRPCSTCRCPGCSAWSGRTSRFTAAAGSPPTTSPRRAPSSSGGPGTCASPG